MSGEGQDPGLTVVGYGMWTAAGHDGPSSVSAMRAGVSGAERANLWDSRSGENLNAFRVHAHQWWEGATFLPALITPVIEDCIAQIPGLLPKSRVEATAVPVLIDVAPSHRPGRDPNLSSIVLNGVAERLGRPLPAGSGVSEGGRTGIPHLLARARTLDTPLAIVVGAESFLRQMVVDCYNGRGRLLCVQNSSGFIAGEAAASVIVARGRQAGLVLTGMGHGMEPGRDGGSKENPTLGLGLTDAIRSALSVARTEFYDIDVLMGDLNGEHFKFKEHTFATMRLDRLPPEGRSRRPREHLEHWNVAETIGETGAALMPAAMCWAFEAGRSGWLPGKAMFTAGEDDGRRVAVVGEWSDG